MSAELRAQAERLIANYRVRGSRLRALALKDNRRRTIAARDGHREAQTGILGQLIALNNRGGSRIGDMLTVEMRLLAELGFAEFFSTPPRIDEIRERLRRVRATIFDELAFLETIPDARGDLMISISSPVNEALAEAEELDWRAGNLTEWLDSHVPGSEGVCRDLEVATRNAVQALHDYNESQGKANGI